MAVINKEWNLESFIDSLVIELDNLAFLLGIADRKAVIDIFGTTTNVCMMLIDHRSFKHLVLPVGARDQCLRRREPWR